MLSVEIHGCSKGSCPNPLLLPMPEAEGTLRSVVVDEKLGTHTAMGLDQGLGLWLSISSVPVNWLVIVFPNMVSRLMRLHNLHSDLGEPF